MIIQSFYTFLSHTVHVCHNICDDTGYLACQWPELQDNHSCMHTLIYLYFPEENSFHLMLLQLHMLSAHYEYFINRQVTYKMINLIIFHNILNVPLQIFDLKATTTSDTIDSTSTGFISFFRACFTVSKLITIEFTFINIFI